MAMKGFTYAFIFVLLATAATTDAKKSKKAGGTWFFPGGGETEPEGNGHGVRSLRSEIHQLELQNNGVLIVKLAAKQPVPKMTALATHWSSLLGSVNVNIETFVLSEDKLIVKVAEQSKGLVPDVKQFLMDENNVLDVVSMAEMEAQAGQENEGEGAEAENEMEQEQELEQEQEYEQKESKKEKGKGKGKESKGKGKKSKKSKK